MYVHEIYVCTVLDGVGLAGCGGLYKRGFFGGVGRGMEVCESWRRYLDCGRWLEN